MSELQIYSTINKCAWVNERQIALLKTLNGSGNDRIRTHEFSRAPEESTLWWFLSQAESWRLHYHLPGLSCDCWQAHGVYKCQSAGPLRGSHRGFAKKKRKKKADWKVTDLRARGLKAVIKLPCCNLWRGSVEMIVPCVFLLTHFYLNQHVDLCRTGQNILWLNMLLSLHRPGGGGATVTSSSAPYIRLLSVFLTQTGVPDEPLTMIWTPVPTHCCTMLRHLTLVGGNS